MTEKPKNGGQVESNINRHGLVVAIAASIYTVVILSLGGYSLASIWSSNFLFSFARSHFDNWANLQNLNLIAVAAISGIVGMFSEQAEHKLNELADTTFGTTPSDKTTATTDEKNLNKIKAAKNRGWQFRHIENKQINQFDSLDGVITEKTRGQRVPQNISR